MFSLLADQGFIDGKGAVDVKLISNLLVRRNVKTAANLLNTAKPEELKQHLDFYEFLYNLNPVAFNFIP